MSKLFVIVFALLGIMVTAPANQAHASYFADFSVELDWSTIAVEIDALIADDAIELFAEPFDTSVFAATSDDVDGPNFGAFDDAVSATASTFDPMVVSESAMAEANGVLKAEAEMAADVADAFTFAAADAGRLLVFEAKKDVDLVFEIGFSIEGSIDSECTTPINAFGGYFALLSNDTTGAVSDSGDGAFLFTFFEDETSFTKSGTTSLSISLDEGEVGSLDVFVTAQVDTVIPVPASALLFLAAMACIMGRSYAAQRA